MTTELTFKFPLHSIIRHKRTGGDYEVLITPDIGRLEATNTRAYSYVNVTDKAGKLVWHRSQEEMEDGRFELVKDKA